jgi:hypothetical protein
MLFAGTAYAQYKLETGLPVIPGQPSPSEGLPQYINYLFIFGLGLITILALAQMMVGGILYVFAAGNVAKVETAKDHIYQALIGLGLLLASYLLLNTINPDLVNLKTPKIDPLQLTGQLTPGMSVEEFNKLTQGTVTSATENSLKVLSSMPDGTTMMTDIGKITKTKDTLGWESDWGYIPLDLKK